MNLTEYNNVYVCGDIHGKFRVLFNKIKSCKISDSLIIIAGDVGLGFYKENYYNVEFTYLKNKYKNLNNKIISVRGNHDNPEYYTGEYDWDILTPVKDYSIIHTRNKNILCVGGALSIDRYKREDDDRKTGDISYWENELPVYNEELLNRDFDTVVTHCSPTICDPYIGNFMTVDRMILDNVYYKSKDRVKEWYYGHYHHHYEMIGYSGIKFVGLDIMEIIKI